MIPNKSNFKFQELTPITGVKPYVLRFWETEFEEICPVTSDSGQKLYARKDVEAILKIKKLLFDDKMSIAEVRDLLRTSHGIPVEDEVIQGAPGIDLHDVKVILGEALSMIHEIKVKRSW